MQRVIERFKDKDVVILPISIDGSGEKAVRPHLEKHGHTFDTLLDQRMEIARQFGVRGTPTFFMNGIRLPNLRGEFFQAAVEWELRRLAAQ